MELYYKVKAAGCAASSERRERLERTDETPLVFELTMLQIESDAVAPGSRADRCLEFSPNLYRKEGRWPILVTGCRFIPEDVFAEISQCMHRLSIWILQTT